MSHVLSCAQKESVQKAVKRGWVIEAKESEIFPA